MDENKSKGDSDKTLAVVKHEEARKSRSHGSWKERNWEVEQAKGTIAWRRQREETLCGCSFVSN